MMTMMRYGEIRGKILERERQGIDDFATVLCDDRSWQSFADELQIPLAELDEYVTIYLSLLPESDDLDGEDGDDEDGPELAGDDDDGWRERPRSALDFPYEPLRDDEAEDDLIGRRCQHEDSYF